MRAGGPLHGASIVCVGFADWDTELWTNQQHLMSRLARENRVLFVESLGLRRPQLAGRDLTRIVRRLRRGVAAAARAPTGVHVLSPLVIPLPRQLALVRALNARPAAARSCAARRGDCGLEQPILWAYVPQAEALLDTLDPCSSSTTASTTSPPRPGIDARRFRAAEDALRARADLVLASAPSLAERMRTLAATCCYAPNVADTALFARALEPGPVDPALDALPQPRIVFTGAVVATKLDFDAARRARARPAATGRSRSSGPVGPGDPAHRRLRARGRAERPPARRARLRATCPTCCAAPTPA